MVGSVDNGASPVANHLGKRKQPDQEQTATQEDPDKQQQGWQPRPSQQEQEPSSKRPPATQQPPPINHNSRKRPADHIITDASSTLLRPTNRPRWAAGVVELGLTGTSTTTPRSPYRFSNNSPQPPVSTDVSRLPGWHFSRHRTAAAAGGGGGGGPSSSLDQGSGRPSLLLFGRQSLSTDTTSTTNCDGGRLSTEGGRASSTSTQPSHQRRRIRGPPASRLGLSPTRLVGTSLLLPTNRVGGEGGGDGGGNNNNSGAGLPEFESVDGGGNWVVGYLPALPAITNNNGTDQATENAELNPIAAALAEAKKKEEVVKTEGEEKNKEEKEAATITAAPPAFTFGGTAIGQEKKKEEEGVTEKPPQAPTFTFGSQPQQQQQQQAAAPVFSFGGVQPSSDTAAAVEQQQPAPFSFTGSAALPGTIPNNNNNNIVFQAGGTQSGSQATSGGRRVVRSRRPRR